MVHVGIGYDVHALVAGRKLILGGVDIPHTKGLDGHSDADALMHAICDAILSRTRTRAGKARRAKFFWRKQPGRFPNAAEKS
jgi:2-C-methyl-D-erythritol 2,4-cyclodiphosphate synthase